MTATPKPAKQINAENNTVDHNRNSHIQPQTKGSPKTKNRAAQKTLAPRVIPAIQAKQEERRATAAIPPVVSEPVETSEPAETIETKQEPAANTAVQVNEPENKPAPETSATQSEQNRSEENKPVNPKSDALNQKPVFPTVTVELPRRKFKFGFTVSAGGGYRLLTRTTNSSKRVVNAVQAYSNPATDTKVIKNHRPAFVFGAGVIASLPLSKKWSLEAGAEYQMLGYNMPAYKTTPVQVNYSSGGVVITTVPADLNSRYVSDPYFANTSVAGQKTLKNQYHYVNVPLTVVYEANPFGRRSFYLKTGAAISYLLNKDAYIYSAETGRYFISPNPETYRNLNIAGVLEGGVRLQLKNNNELRVGMNFGFNLLPTHNQDITLREYLYQSGIKISYLLR